MMIHGILKQKAVAASCAGPAESAILRHSNLRAVPPKKILKLGIALRSHTFLLGAFATRNVRRLHGDFRKSCQNEEGGPVKYTPLAIKPLSLSFH